LLIQWSFGITLVHELAVSQSSVSIFHCCPNNAGQQHAVWILRTRADPSSRVVSNEPYFEDEPVAELGNSLANALTNGCFFFITPGRNNRGEYPLVVGGRVPWPTKYIESGDNPTLYKISEGLIQEYFYPIPVGYFWRVQQEDFWVNHVPAFGSQSLYIEPLTQGRAYRADQVVLKTQKKVNPDVDAETIRKSRSIFGEIAKLKNEIIQSWSKTKAEFRELGEAVDAALKTTEQKGADPEYLYVEEQEVFDPPQRHQEITDLLIKYRTVLAIYTQDFAIPELTFLAYVNRLNVLDIERGEWRQFLQYMTYTKKELLQ
jgi:hypothetical protein